jgi:hypothetical protein
MFRVDVRRDAETECWSELLSGFVEEITFLAEENAGAPSFGARRAQLLAAAFDVDASATTSLVIQRSIDSQEMVEYSPPEKSLSFLFVVAVYGPVELLTNCLFGRVGLSGNGSNDPSRWMVSNKDCLARQGDGMIRNEDRGPSCLQ